MINTRKVKASQVAEYVDLCYDHFAEYNGYKYDMHNTFTGKPFTENTSLYIVHRGSKDVGFFKITSDQIGEEIGVEFWMNPRACNMGLLSVVKAGAITAYLCGKDNDYKYLNFKVKDALSARQVSKLLPGVITTKHTPNYYVCFGELNNLPEFSGSFRKFNDDYTFEIDV